MDHKIIKVTILVHFLTISLILFLVILLDRICLIFLTKVFFFWLVILLGLWEEHILDRFYAFMVMLSLGALVLVFSKIEDARLSWHSA